MTSRRFTLFGNFATALDHIFTGGFPELLAAVWDKVFKFGKILLSSEKAIQFAVFSQLEQRHKPSKKNKGLLYSNAHVYGTSFSANCSQNVPRISESNHFRLEGCSYEMLTFLSFRTFRK